jgi:lysophospholipase L1-like esterase
VPQSPPRDTAASSPRWLYRARTVLVYAAVFLVVTAVSIGIAFKLTPLQSVSALGETVEVGAAAPTLSVRGPGVLDLFGQTVPTALQFPGPVRPRLALSRITLNSQVAGFLQPSHRGDVATELGRGLAGGWVRYFVWESVIVAASAVLLLGAIAGWRRFSWRKTLMMIGAGLVFAEVINVGGILVTAFSVPRILSQVGSLQDLVGRAAPGPVIEPAGPPVSGFQAVVIGDSTAAGVGLGPVADPTPQDTACQRSSDSYAAALGRVNQWNVLNLGCSGATIPSGVLGAQGIGSQTIPAQLAVAKQATRASVIAISIGADDLQWSATVQLCAAATTCDDNATTAFFQTNLATFTENYYQLLQQLAGLPQHPTVLVNLYYDPFGPNLSCLDAVGITADKVKVLDSRLASLNAVLKNGADASGFDTVAVNFAGHELCTRQPFVQGLSSNAPFHPTVAGGLAIALADEQALVKSSKTPLG